MISISGLNRVDISPGVRVFSLFQHLNYRSWYALAEFVDNSLQSFLTNREALSAAQGCPAKLIVRIGFDATDGGRITVRDNAAGINAQDYQRAFKTASPPLDRSGLSQFGVGMKSAACWFARRWSVRSKALGEDVERFISFDVAKIVSEGIETLTPEVTPADPSDHFTEITLDGLHNLPQGRTVRKIRDHLASIYRAFIRDGALQLWFNQELLCFTEPKVLTARYFRDPTGEPRVWRKEIDFDLGGGQQVHGFAALRETASTSDAGFALFHRRRLIQGSNEEGYRPPQIFGQPNSYTYQRLFGELDLEGFEVTHTKDGFRLDQADEETFLDLLREHLDAEPLPLLRQAEGYRARPKANDPDLKKAGEEALNSTARVIEENAGPVVQDGLAEGPQVQPLPANLEVVAETSERTFMVTVSGIEWEINLELTRDPAVEPWVELADTVTPGGGGKDGRRRLQARLALQHPFMLQFAGSDRQRIEPLLRVAAALVLAETMAREAGVQMAGTIRMHLNSLLRRALADP